jgi:hypothetical protein
MKLKVFITPIVTILFLGITSFSQDAVPDLSYSIVASKNGVKHFYKPGDRVLIKYKDSDYTKKMRGFYSGESGGNLVMKRKKKGIAQSIIAVDSIIILRRIHPVKRMVYAVIGTSVVGGGAAILENGGDSPGSAMKGAFIIPVIAVGVFFICAVPVTLIVERINERKRSAGWQFELQ